MTSFVLTLLTLLTLLALMTLGDTNTRKNVKVVKVKEACIQTVKEKRQGILPDWCMCLIDCIILNIEY